MQHKAAAIHSVQAIANKHPIARNLSARMNVDFAASERVPKNF